MDRLARPVLGLRLDRRDEPVPAPVQGPDHPLAVAVVPERPPYFVERATVFVGDQRASEFVLTPAVSPDPRLRFFVRAEPGTVVRVVFVNNRGERWEANQRLG